MSSKESHRERRTARPRRRAERVAVEGLEPRQLMAYSPFGYSLPDLTVSGYSAPTASWGGSLTIDVNVLNTGASSLVEPTHLPPGYIGTPDSQGVSNANSPPTTVQVFASISPNAKTGLLPIDKVDIPGISQNSNFETISTVILPPRPPGFPGNGGTIYLTYVVNNTKVITESDPNNNVFRVPTPVKIADPLPDLQVVGFNLPTTLQPGQVIAPTIRIANFGAADPAAQAPVTVQIVASVDKNFGPGDAVVASYTIASIPGISGVPTQGSIANDANVIPTPNENTTLVPAFKLPTTPGTYFLGIVIDPLHLINQTYAPNPRLRALVTVGPPDQFLPAGGQIFTGTGLIPVFPAAPSTVIRQPTIVGTPQPTTPIVVTTPSLFSGATLSGKATDAVSSKAIHAKAVHVAPHARPHKVAHAKSKY